MSDLFNRDHFERVTKQVKEMALSHELRPFTKYPFDENEIKIAKSKQLIYYSSKSAVILGKGFRWPYIQGRTPDLWNLIITGTQL